MSHKLTISLVLLLSILLLILATIASASADPPLTISFIDVGQGDSILIHGDDNIDILIDGDGGVSNDEIEEIRTITNVLKLTHKQFIEAKLKIPRERRAN